MSSDHGAERGALGGLIQALRCLPGVGARSAARMAYHLLQHDRTGAMALSSALATACDCIGHCRLCHTFSEAEVCSTCADASRDPSLLCVVETPADQAALERTRAYNGLYFVLLGRISPLDGVGPLEIGLDRFLDRLADGVVNEVVIATNFTAEGEATAHALMTLAQSKDVRTSRLSRGVPVGSELEYVDLGTIAHALMDRR